MAKKSQTYDENSITTYEYPENIQKKPSMYIGDIGIEGCTHMIREVIDNSVDEALNGFGTTIVIRISNEKGYVSVEDYGRGIPPKAIEKAFCTLHASGKFDNNEYSASAGTNGVGTTAVNALSKSFIVESVRDGKSYIQKFSDGLPITKLKANGIKKKNSGTTVYFEPNAKFMQEVKFDIDTIKDELSTKIYVLKGIKIMLVNEDTKEKFTMLSENGLSDYIKKYTKESICSPIKISKEVEFTRPGYKDHFNNEPDQKLKFSFDMEFSYDRRSHTDIISFCNSLLMREGGIQETTFKTALTRFFKSYIEQNKILSKKDEKLLEKINGDHVTDGLVGIISIKHPDPIFQNQTKQKLKSTEVGQISKYITEALEEFAATNPKEIKNICQKIIVSVKAYEAAKNARETVQKKGENQFAIVSDLSKLANCISKDINENELFITEGRSASGTAKEARDKKTQAVYSLRGKMLNTIGLPAAKVLANKECADLAYITTGEKNAIRENFDISMLKYGKIIMQCDADVDGFAIVILGAVYYFENMRPVIEDGHFYVAIPPLYSIVEKGKKRYFVDQDDYDEYIFTKVLDNYSFVNSSKKKITTVSKIKSIFNKYEILSNFIDSVVKNNTGLDSQLLIDYLNIVLKEEVDTATFVGDYTEDITYNKKTKVYDGFYNGNYVSFTDVSIWKALGTIDEFIEENKIPLTDIYYLNENNKYVHFTIDRYRKIIKEVTPKSRCRMKGLGEMDPDELRDTTMDKEKRNIYRITIEDVEKAIECLNNYMNGASKFADIRKDILLRKQDEIAKLNLI